MANLDIIRGRQVVIPLMNRTGGAVIAGDVVVLDAANDDSFVTTTTVGDTRTVGVVQESIADLGVGRVLIAGYCPLVNVNAAVTRGQYLQTHSVAKQGQGVATRGAGAMGQFSVGGATPKAVLWGAPSASGLTGATGPTGATGAAGATGATGPTGPAGPPLIIEEVDGSPTHSAPTKLVMPNGTLGLAGSVMTYTPAGGGGSALTVEEVDGSPTDAAVTKIVFPNNTLGIAGHVATYTPAAGGGGGGGGGGALVFLDQKTADNTSPNLDFASVISSLYDDYMVEVVNLLHATDAQGLVLQYSSDGGSSWVNTGYQWSYTYLAIGGTGTSVVNSASDTSIRLANANKAVSTGGINGSVHLFDPQNTTKHKRVAYDLLQTNSGDGNAYYYRGGAVLLSTTAMNALRVASTSGNLVSGVVRVYGIAKTAGGGGGGSAPLSGARVRRTTSVAGIGGTVSNIAFDAETGGLPACFDTGSYHDNSTNPERLTVPTAGYYEFGVYANWATGELTSPNSASLAIILSSSKGQFEGGPAYAQYIGRGFAFSTGPVYLAAGDYATISYLNDAGLDISAGMQFWVRALDVVGVGGGSVGGGGALVFLAEKVAASSASLDFVGFFSSDYDDYMIEVINLAPATNAVAALIQVGTGGGPTYDTTTNYFPGGGGAAQTGINLASPLSNSGAGYGSVSGSMRLVSPQSATAMKFAHGTTVWHDGTNAQGGGRSTLWGVTTALTAIRVIMSSGNIASGIVRLYGIAKTAGSGGGGSGGAPTYVEAVCTANTVITVANSPTDITGCSLVLGAGNWKVEGMVSFRGSGGDYIVVDIANGAGTSLRGVKGAMVTNSAGNNGDSNQYVGAVKVAGGTTVKLRFQSQATGTTTAFSGSTFIWATQVA